MGKRVLRLQQVFWLDVTKPDQFELAELIGDLKRQRAFSRVVRDGIRLMVDLWQGRVEVLLALFPWVEEYFFERFSELQPATDQDIAQQLANLERLLLEQGNKPIASITATSGNPKPLIPDSTPRPMVLPDQDDDDDVQLIVQQATSDGRASQNFLDSAFSLLG